MCVLAVSFRSKFSAPPLYPWKRNGLSTTSTNSHSRRRSSSSKSPQPLSDHYLSCPVPEKPLSVAVLPTSKSGSKKALKCPWEYDLKYATHVCVQVVHLTDEYWERVVQYQTYFLSHLSQSQLKQQFPLMTSCHYINNIKLQLLASGNGHHLKHENYPG
ncbi:unnamed protein product [Brassica oleracea]